MAKVTVRDDNILHPPLFEGDAKFVIVRDSNGEPAILLVNLIKDTWGICKKSDNDWEEVLKRFGVK